jgi:hypothetical protein
VDTMCCHVHDFVHNKNHTDETSATPTSIWAILLVVCRLLPPNHLIPTDKLLFFYNPGGTLCVSASVGWCRTQNNILSNSMQVVFTLPAFFFSISFFTWLCWRSEHCGIFVVRFDFLMARPLWRMQHTLVRRFYLMLVIHFE